MLDESSTWTTLERGQDKEFATSTRYFAQELCTYTDLLELEQCDIFSCHNLDL